MIVVRVLGVQGDVKVLGLKGLVDSKNRPSTTYTLRKYIPQFESIVGVSIVEDFG